MPHTRPAPITIALSDADHETLLQFAQEQGTTIEAVVAAILGEEAVRVKSQENNV